MSADWTARPRELNALSEEVRLVRVLYDTIFDLKAGRARLEALAVPAIPDEDYPPPGELSHLTAPRVKAALAALDVLDTALTTPTKLGGQTAPPLVALVGVMR